MKRPGGITILAFVAFAIGAFLAWWAFRAIAGGYIVATTVRSPLVPNAEGSAISFFGIVIAVCAVLFAIDGIGLLKLKRWARLMTFGLVAISLIFDLMLTVMSLVNSRIFVMLFWMCFAGIDAFLLWYLSQPIVKHAFGSATSAAPAAS